MEGAQQALDIAEYLTIKLDDLTEPKIMQIDTSEVEEDLRKPIEKMQEIVELSKEKNLVTLTGDTAEIEKTQNKINEVAKEIEELDPEIKAQVGIDEDWDAETIASKIEKGEVEIPASLELDVQMSDDLKDIRLLMMGQLGIVDKNEIKLKVGYDIDESLVDTLDDKEQTVVIEYITKNEEEFNKLTDEEKEVVAEKGKGQVNETEVSVVYNVASMNVSAIERIPQSTQNRTTGYTPKKDIFKSFTLELVAVI